MEKPLYAVILAGGKGERFWPLSTPEHPKPFLKLFSDRSLLQQTFDRATDVTTADRILVVVGEQHGILVRDQLPGISESQILLEPSGRDTSAAIGFASLHLPSDGVMLVMPADHIIPDRQQFARIVSNAVALVADHGGPCTFGIVPSRPETNYGYILASSRNVGPRDFPVFEVECFVEKPDPEKAAEFLRRGSYYWNSGIFIWTVSRIHELLAQHLPGLWDGIRSVYSEPDGERKRNLYASLSRISIDFGVMQKADRVVMVPAAFSWDDVGTWNSLPRILSLDENRNLVRGDHVGMETGDCILYAETLKMVTAGVQNLVIVQRGEHLLICHRDYADRLKELLVKLPT